MTLPEPRRLRRAPSLAHPPLETTAPATATLTPRATVLPADGSVDESPDSPPLPEWKPSQGRHPAGAIVIPAHNEANVIGRTLSALAPLCEATDIEVIVVCNGCTDETAAIAREVPGVTVIEVAEASKTAAMNVGDEHASSWPRLYLDADIEVAPDAVLAVFEELECPGVAAARPIHVYDTSGAAASVKSYYRARSRIPERPPRLWGAGGYAVSQAGHRRFSAFPAVTSDDSWFDEQFDEREKRIVATHPMRVRTPRDLQGLLAVLTRQRRGQVELGAPSMVASRGRSLLASVRRPRDLADTAWYVALTLIARRRSRVALRARAGVWERDASSRPVEGTSR